MKKLQQLIITTFLFFTPMLWAEHDNHDHNHEGVSKLKEVSGKQVDGVEGAVCENTINVKVNGLVCDFCARALEKVIGKRDDVTGINVDLNNGKVDIAMKEGKNIDDATLTKLIKDSGYNVVDINKGC